ncbi:hypothetical protein ACU4GD_05800 [Cupriavidus basilensis]
MSGQGPLPVRPVEAGGQGAGSAGHAQLAFFRDRIARRERGVRGQHGPVGLRCDGGEVEWRELRHGVEQGTDLRVELHWFFLMRTGGCAAVLARQALQKAKAGALPLAMPLARACAAASGFGVRQDPEVAGGHAVEDVPGHGCRRHALRDTRL